MAVSPQQLDDAVRSWREDGWALLDGLVAAPEIDQAMAEVDVMVVPTPIGPTRRADQVGARFRAAQFDGTTLFPLPDAPYLNRLIVHPKMVGFAQAAMACDDLRIYQSRLWSKHAEHTSYEQPMHTDGNHSLVPTRSEVGYWNMECFLYLSDVDETNGAPRIVPRSVDAPGPNGGTAAGPDERPDLFAAERVACGSRGTLLAYRPDVWHRGVDLHPGTERHVLVVAFKPAGTDWIGFDAHPPLVSSKDFKAFAAACTPDELAMFGVPRPGHPYWTTAMVDSMADLYPGLDVRPWREQLP